MLRFPAGVRLKAPVVDGHRRPGHLPGLLPARVLRRVRMPMPGLAEFAGIRKLNGAGWGTATRFAQGASGAPGVWTGTSSPNGRCLLDSASPRLLTVGPPLPEISPARRINIVGKKRPYDLPIKHDVFTRFAISLSLSSYLAARVSHASPPPFRISGSIVDGSDGSLWS